jgi:hypothetical protein
MRRTFRGALAVAGLLTLATVAGTAGTASASTTTAGGAASATTASTASTVSPNWTAVAGPFVYSGDCENYVRARGEWGVWDCEYWSGYWWALAP